MASPVKILDYDQLDLLPVPESIKPQDVNKFKVFRRWVLNPDLSAVAISKMYGCKAGVIAYYQSIGLKNKWIPLIK